MADYLFEYLSDAWNNPAKAELDIERLPEEFRQFGQGLQFFVANVNETREFAKALSVGDLRVDPPARSNEVAAPLKALHASLRHMTWQSQQVAKGDYNQRIDFMGEFSEAFNTMTVRLEEQRAALVEEIENSRQKTVALAQSISLLEAVTDQITQWIVVVERNSGEWLFTNHEPGRVLRTAACEEKLRQWLAHCVAEEDMATQGSRDFSLVCEEETQYYEVAYYNLQWHGQQAVAFVLTDVSEEKQRINELENVAYHDPLTQVHNRHYGMQVLQSWVDGHRQFVLSFVDIDNLKYVNDRYGHAEGDHYIRLVADMLQEFCPDVLVCRLGGDEFMLMVSGWTMTDAEERMKELRSQINDSPLVDPQMYHADISYGVIEVAPDNVLGSSELLSIADEKMYVFKRANKARRKQCEAEARS